MSKDVGMTIHNSIVSFLPCLAAFLAFHPISLNVFLLFLLLFWGGGKKTMNRCGCTAAACSRDSYSSKTITDNSKAIRAKIAGRRNTQH